MKKIISLSLLLIVVLCSSCKKNFLNKESFTDFDESILKKPEGIKALLNGVYDTFSSNSYYGCNMYAFEASKGPDFFVRQSSGNSFERENRYSESTSSPGAASATWIKIYSAIKNATSVLHYIEQTEGLTADEKDRIIGEAKALRALAYFDLMRLFAYAPRFSIPGGAEYNEKFKWGVPILKTLDMINNPRNYQIRRETAKDTYKYIEDEFLEAKTLLALKNTDKGHINHVAVCALLSRLYLYLERWEDVITFGEEALTSPLNKYSLLPYDSYKTSYYRSFNSENIWELTYSLADNLGSGALNHFARKPTYNIPGAVNDGQVMQDLGYAALGLIPETVNELKYSVSGVEDVRAYLVCQLGIPGKAYNTLRKYVGESYHSVYNLPVVRLPEIYLNLAEAYLNHGGKVVEAEKYYNLLRQARIKSSGFGTTDPNTCKTLVLKERRRELILEGHTFWDYFRRGEAVIRPQLLENANKRTIAFGYGFKTNARLQVIYPIPLNELQANIAIRDQQNPGYASYDDVFIGN